MKRDSKEMIKQLESLLIEKVNINENKAIPFASRTMDLIKKAMGIDSHQYKTMLILLYDQEMNKIQGIFQSSTSLIVERINEVDAFDDLINDCISFVKSFGIYKPPTDKKNILGDLDNSILWTFIVSLMTVSFLAGIFLTNFGLKKYFNPALNDTSNQEVIQTQKANNKLSSDQQKIPKKNKEEQ